MDESRKEQVVGASCLEPGEAKGTTMNMRLMSAHRGISEPALVTAKWGEGEERFQGDPEIIYLRFYFLLDSGFYAYGCLEDMQVGKLRD